MHQETIVLNSDDRVIVKELWKFPVPTAYEVKLLLDCFPDYSQETLGFGFMVVPACRPIEVTRLRWPKFFIKDGIVEKFRHYINKPVGRTTRMGKNYEEKEIEKPVIAWSKWLNNQIIGYAKIAPSHEGQYLFQWGTSDGISKCLTRLRKRILADTKKYGAEYACFFDQNSYVRLGPNQPIPYRINPYSLRRFSMTFHFYVTYKMDPIATAKAFGHSEAATTLGHYIMPKEAIGLTKEMIDDDITMDEFIHLHGKKQMRIIDYNPEWEKHFTPVGQTSLSAFVTELPLDV